MNMRTVFRVWKQTWSNAEIGRRKFKLFYLPLRVFTVAVYDALERIDGVLLAGWLVAGVVLGHV